MKFVFWQKFVSSHQTAFLLTLSKYHEVVLVVDYVIDENRHKMGWDFVIPDQIKVIIEPSDSKILEVLKMADHNVISGFRDGICVKRAILVSKINKLPFYMLLEPPMYIDKFSFHTLIRYLIYKLFFIRYQDIIKAIFAIGKSGFLFYNNIFDKNKVFEFGYFIDEIARKDSSSDFKNKENILSFAFVGSLVPRKGLLKFLKLFLRIKDLVNFKFRIFGDGPEIDNIVELISKSSYEKNFEFYGFLRNNEVLDYLKKNDVLVLFNQNTEGWGVVINEAIISGNYIICTELTGASVVVEENPEFGLILKHNISFTEFKKKIIHLFQNYQINSQSVKNLARSGVISPKSAVIYFLAVIDFSQQKSEKPVAPWRRL